MKPQQLWDLFDWYRGACFRCEASGVPVAHVGDITVKDKALPLFACHRCIFRMQQSHWFRTTTRAWPLYRLQLPGPSEPRASRPQLGRWLLFGARRKGRHRHAS
ncbi:hypothetical protein [Streptomyces brasiliscabiei]|uniref:hypothetical protein n=1 Tax=Streptomyces brasiliscabiei TaxID=2736302 RepID=UPI001C10E026|nr:hypothetical protein [Streptomyces brasiliscabiei]